MWGDAAACKRPLSPRYLPSSISDWSLPGTSTSGPAELAVLRPYLWFGFRETSAPSFFRFSKRA